jgi:hypothetical protein
VTRRRACSCTDFVTSHASAGDGLPAIEPGMPLPAGTGLSRRSFLAKGLGFALTVYGLDKLSAIDFDTGLAQAASSNRVVVSIFLDGGVDSLSALFPAGDGRYSSAPRSRCRSRQGLRSARTLAYGGIRRSARSRSCTQRER